MKCLLTLAVLIALPALAKASEPKPAVAPDPLVALVQACVEADALVAKTTADEKAAADALLAANTAKAKAFADFAAEWAKRYPPLPTPTPVPPPTPPPTPPPVPPAPLGPVTSFLVIGSPSCAPCIAMYPAIEELAAGGMKIKHIDDSTAEAAPYKVEATPTTIVLVNGKEETRYVGKLSKAALVDWFARCEEWAKLKYGPKAADELPSPPKATNTVERYQY